MRASDHGEVETARRFLDALFANAAGGLVELRFRRGDRMGQRFHPVHALERAARDVVALGRRADVFVGVVPRARRGGRRRDLVERSSVVWADCDGEAAARRLERFRPAPSLVVASGSGANRHAYWLLNESLAPSALERVNRCLAQALGADHAATDAARILRPGGSLNHKHSPPTPVEIATLAVGARIAVPDLIGECADPLAPEPADGEAHQACSRPDDPLASIPPAEYVERLTGQRVGRSRKVRCPLHERSRAEPARVRRARARLVLLRMPARRLHL